MYVDPIEPANIDEYLWAPCLHDPPLTTFEALADDSWPRPRVTLDDLADMHEAMAVQSEYHRRYREAEEADRKAKEKR